MSPHMMAAAALAGNWLFVFSSAVFNGRGVLKLR